MFERLLNLKNNPTFIFIITLSKMLANLLVFYTLFLVKELSLLSYQNLFLWKSVNFADSYWFLYNDKATLHEILITK